MKCCINNEEKFCGNRHEKKALTLVLSIFALLNPAIYAESNHVIKQAIFVTAGSSEGSDSPAIKISASEIKFYSGCLGFYIDK